MKQKNIHSPNLDTILMVEAVLEDTDSRISVAELKRRLPKQVNHYTLMQILAYLADSNKIDVGLKGIQWVHLQNSRLKKLSEKQH